MLAFLKEVSEVLVVMKMLPHMPHEAVLNSVADQAFFEADTDRYEAHGVWDCRVLWRSFDTGCKQLCPWVTYAGPDKLMWTSFWHGLASP